MNDYKSTVDWTSTHQKKTKVTPNWQLASAMKIITETENPHIKIVVDFHIALGCGIGVFRIMRFLTPKIYLLT